MAQMEDDLGHLMVSANAMLASMTDAEITAMRKKIFGSKQGAAFSADALLGILRSYLLIQVALQMDVRNR